VAAVEEHTLDGASTITLMKHRHGCEMWWQHRSHAWMAASQLL